MRTKALLAILIVCTVLFAGCAATAAAVSQSSEPDAPQSAVSALDTSTPRGEKPFKQPDENGIVGKITAISETEVTLALASVERPEGRGQSPGGDGTQPSERPERNGSMPDKRPDRASGTSMMEPPSGNQGVSGSSPGGGRGGMNMSFTGETVTYAFLDNISIKKGMGDNGETLEASDLVVDDVIRIELDDNGQVAVVYIMTADLDRQPTE